MSRRARRHVLAVPAIAGTLLITGAAGSALAGPDTRAVPVEELQATVTEVATGLERPTAVVALDDGRLLVTEKGGTLRTYHPDTGLAAEPLLDISDRVSETENERGLLGVAVAPDFAQSQAVYVAYTRASDEAVTLSRLHADSGAEDVLLVQEHADFGNHNGGQVSFGADGYLYWGLGDGGGSGDPLQNGQNLDTLLGKILRLDVSTTCGELAYCVPEGNPFVGVDGARAEIWSYGLRNPWRFSFDAADGSLWIGDVGQGRFEEVDHVAADAAGVNFGWSCMEGPVVYNEERCDETATYTAPVFSYATGTEGCAVIGGHVYRGAEFADLADGTYVAADYCSASIFAVRPNGDGSYASATVGTGPNQPTALGTDAAGELYLTDDGGGLSRVAFEHVPAR